MKMINSTHDLFPIWEKVQKAERLTFDDGVQLLQSKDLLAVGYMANYVRELKHQDKTYFVTNRHINYTNVCALRCKLCAFGVDQEAESAYTMTLEQIEQHAHNSAFHGLTELHIVGGLNPQLSLQYYETMLKRLSDILPDAHIKAFTAVEIDFLAKENDLSVDQVLLRLQAAGLGSLPGGGAEIFAQRVRERICPNKISGGRWLYIHETAHTLGMRSNATMLYGHIETVEEQVDHFLRLRELQDKTGGFQTFIPLAFHPKNTVLSEEVDGLGRTTGLQDMRMIAVARLLLDNFDHIKAYWVMIGPKLAQLSLHFGANDTDGTVIEERITHAAGASTDQAMTKADMIKLIRDAGRQPIERDTLYNVVNKEFV